MKYYSIINHVTKEKYIGHRGREYTDLDLARFWAIQKSEELNAVVALYDGDEIRNLYRKGKAIKFSDMKTFEMNGKAYQTDKETLELLREIIPKAKQAKDFSAVIAVMDLGEQAGRIKEITV